LEKPGALLLAVVGLFSFWANPLAAQTDSSHRQESEVPDSVRRDLGHGRFWKASRALRIHLNPVESASLQDRMVLAEAEAGWKNWEGAVAALSVAGSDTAEVPARLWYMLGVALQESGDDQEAAGALARFVESVPRGSSSGLAARSRLSRALAETGAGGDAVAATAELHVRSPLVGDWTALEVARILSPRSEAEAVGEVLALVVDPSIRRAGWRLEVDAWAASGDPARALEALAAVDRTGDGPATPAAILAIEWPLRLALGDSAGAVAAMEGLLRLTTRGSAATKAAMAHWEVAVDSGPEILRLVAVAMGSGGEFGHAVRAWRLAERRGAVLSERERMARARAFNGSGDRNGAVEAYRELSASGDPSIAGPALQAWAGIRTRQGRYADARTLQNRLVERFPSRAEALDVVFFRGDDHQDAGRLGEAVSHYQSVVSMSSSADRAGLARMRWAQIHLARGEVEAAREVFRAYLAEFPDGRRWEEASYWGARAASMAGDSAEARALLARLQGESPLSYYTFLTDTRDGGSFSPDLSGSGPLPDPEWLPGELEALALLEEAGLEDGAAARVSAMRTAAGDSEELLLRLAVALHEAGRTLDGIRLGLELRRRGRDWDLTLARVVYPFPYRELVTARAEELGLDPFLLAGIIRQESAFVPAIVSPAGAIGLMQVMPATGRQLAGRIGPGGFRTETLETPELNVHLGSRFLADMLRRYDNDIPLVLSAYNAGPTRANRWRTFPEAEDPHRFTERIPFGETRGYVKNVTRNRALYRWLYGGRGEG